MTSEKPQRNSLGAGKSGPFNRPSGDYRQLPCPPQQEPPRPRPPPPPCPTPPDTDAHKHSKQSVLVTGMTVMGSMLGSALLLCIFFALVKLYFNRRNHSRRRRSLPVFFVTRDDFLDEDRGPHLDNPIWYINTVGLQQSIIDSITVFNYKTDEGLIDGTECSVCLNEFQEDESLRLLPKCSHAFHLPCIDTWLRSHKNCPLCRAPVICESMIAQTSASSEPNSIDSGSSHENDAEISENRGSGLGRNDVGEGGTSEELRTCSIQVQTRSSDSGSHVLSDLANIQDDIQPIRRSVSLDLTSAMEVYSEVAGLATAAHKHRGSLDTELQQLKHPKGKGTIVGKRSSGSSSICKLMKSSSIGRSLSKGSTSMKRSIAYGGKSLLSKQNRSQDSILPL